jgi:L-iditol 2-dehydrogenase
LVEGRLKMAKDLGADFVLKIETTSDAAQLAKTVAEQLGEMPNISIECSGAESSIKLAILVPVLSYVVDCLKIDFALRNYS